MDEILITGLPEITAINRVTVLKFVLNKKILEMINSLITLLFQNFNFFSA